MTIEELEDYGMVRMEESDLRGFLSSQRVGVLALPAADAPTMRPLSYTFDGDSRLYFRFVLGSTSEKKTLTDRVDVARFLVFRTDTRYNWASVLLTGTIEAVSAGEQDRLGIDLKQVRRPDLFEQAEETVATHLYRFEIEAGVGLKHHGLPPGFEADSSEIRSEE